MIIEKTAAEELGFIDECDRCEQVPETGYLQYSISGQMYGQYVCQYCVTLMPAQEDLGRHQVTNRLIAVGLT